MRICKQLDFASGLLKLPVGKGKIKDNRFIYRFLFMSTVFSKKSFLQMDQWGRLEKVKRLFRVNRFSNSRYRNTTVSDSTIAERLTLFESGKLREMNYRFLARAQEGGYVEENAIVDGSGIGKRLYSCLSFITRWGDVFFTDMEEIPRRGRELLSSERLIRRSYALRGKRPIGYLLMDALYFTERFYRLRQQGYVRELVIKYTPVSPGVSGAFRKVLERFEQMVSRYKDKGAQAYLHRMGFVFEKGFDKKQHVSYTIYRARNNSLDNRYQIARVIERRGGKLLQQFYVITTDKELSGKEMRLLAHQRWYIENNGFKSLNGHVHSKRCWSHDEKSALNLLLIQLLAFSFLQLFRRRYGRQIGREYRHCRVTLHFVSSVLMAGSFRGVVWQES